MSCIALMVVNFSYGNVLNYTLQVVNCFCCNSVTTCYNYITICYNSITTITNSCKCFSCCYCCNSMSCCFLSFLFVIITWAGDSVQTLMTCKKLVQIFGQESLFTYHKITSLCYHCCCFIAIVSFFSVISTFNIILLLNHL